MARTLGSRGWALLPRSGTGLDPEGEKMVSGLYARAPGFERESIFFCGGDFFKIWGL